MIAGSALLLLLAVFFVVLVAKGRFFPNAGNRGEERGASPEQLGESLGGGRKNIYDRNYMELAVSFRRSSIYVRPLELEQPEEVAGQVARILGLDKKNILATLRGERSFSWLGRDLSQKKAAEIAELNLKGVYRMDQVHRYYPGGQLGSHVLGFLKDEQGLAGVEFSYDSVLRGGGVHDPRLVAAGISNQFAEGGDGASLVLTLDILLQSIVEQRLRGLVAVTGAESATAVLMAPDTGEIVALASVPSYDPNRYWEYSAEQRRNRAVEDVVEPGGMGALFHMAAALDRKAAAEKMVWGPAGREAGDPAAPTAVWQQTEEGTYVSAELFDLARVAVDNGAYAAFIDEIGLTSRGEIDLPEALFALRDGGIDQRSALFAQTDGEMEMVPLDLAESPQAGAAHQEKGHGQTATAVTLLSAFSRLVNGGRVMTPHVLRALWYEGKIWNVPSREGERDFVVRPDVSQSLLAGMKPWARGPENIFVLESLSRRNGIPAVVQDPAALSAGEEEGPLEKTVVANSILLGMAPASRPEIAMIVVLEGAAFDIAAHSPVRRLAQELLPLAAAALAKQPSLPSAKELAVREVAYYRKWEKNIEEIESQPALAQGAEGVVMPDVRGLSLRKAMQALQQYGLKPQIKGSGMVVRQSPQAGAPLKGVNQCVLELKAEQ